MATLTAVIAAAGLPALSTSAAACPLTGGDYDDDGLSCYDEVNLHWTDPFTPDTDVDGLADGVEWLYPSNPLYPDTDGDGYTDGYEYQAGTDLLNPLSFPPPGVR